MGFIEKSERKFGKFAVHGLTAKLVVVQVLAFLFLMTAGRYEPLYKILIKLNIGNNTVISDFISIIAAPSASPFTTMGFVWMLIATQLLWMFGHALQDLWGDYKFTLYILTHVILSVLASQFFDEVFFPLMYTSISTTIFYAFATYYPNFTLNLYFILPVPVKYLALLSAGFQFYMISVVPYTFLKVFIFVTSFGAYLLFHYSLFINRQKQKHRAAAYQKRVADPTTFHKCHECGRTEVDDAQLEFRICDDGEEYCVDHLKL
ncbi:MAG: hypothetical protein HRT88_10375 [Lentisphaeraceae bacterium]|nr:hypothetical protein [Lentisphaeraceae bacterium]